MRDNFSIPSWTCFLDDLSVGTHHKMVLLLEFLIPVLVLFVVYVYRRLKERRQYWKVRGVPHLSADSLIFGNDYEYITGKLTMAENCAQHYKQLAPHKFGGVYHYFTPILYVRDPELMKDILIKDFHHFYDRNPFHTDKADPLSLHLFNLIGEEWKAMRSKLTPTFTSGKMKMSFQLLEECVEKLNGVIEESALNGEVVQVDQLMTGFAIDVICSYALGIETDSIHDAGSILRAKGKARFSPSWRTRMREAIQSLWPGLISFLRFKETPQDVADFFINLLDETIQYRKQNGVVRNDFLNLLMAIQNDETEDAKRFDFNIGILAAQCQVFVVAGFETTSTLLSLTLHQLTKHPDVQEKLQAEVDAVLQKTCGKVTYECLQEMRYMDQVIDETLRLFPPSPRLARVCTEDYRIPGSEFVVRKGQYVILPVGAIMKDPQYFPDPEVFNPENFSEKAINSRPLCCFLPFGAGPRNCIARRFALMEIKLALASMMKEFTVSSSSKMELPIKFKPHIILSTLNSRILLHFDKRVKT